MNKRSAGPFSGANTSRFSKNSNHPLRSFLLSAGCFFTLAGGATSAAAQNSPAPATATRNAGLAPIRQYISDGWNTLTRSLSECSNVVDPKLAASQSVLYFPADFAVPPAIQALQKRCSFQINYLPKKIEVPGEIDPGTLSEQGLLYLEHPYVVPGGRFNEMYGWDSYFIIRGLVRDNRVELARDMVENFFFEIAQYGEVLNANRSYY